MPPCAMRTLAFSTPLFRVGLLAALGCLINAVFAGSYTPPTPPPSPARHRYPVGYDPDNRHRPCAYPAKHILLTKPLHPPTSTRGEAKTARWLPPQGYVPRRRQNEPTLRRTDAHGQEQAELVTSGTERQNCLMSGCQLDPRKHLCTGIWMGTTILNRVCLKTED